MLSALFGSGNNCLAARPGKAVQKQSHLSSRQVSLSNLRRHSPTVETKFTLCDFICYHCLLPERQSHGHGASCFSPVISIFWEVGWGTETDTLQHLVNNSLQLLWLSETVLIVWIYGESSTILIVDNGLNTPLVIAISALLFYAIVKVYAVALRQFPPISKWLQIYAKLAISYFGWEFSWAAWNIPRGQILFILSKNHN